MANTETKVASKGFLDSYFKISERGSTVGREVRGGLVTFFSMCYIIVLNPLILGLAPDSTGAYLGAQFTEAGASTPGAGIPLIAAATALVAGILSIAMGSIANYPLALAAGLGLNALVAYTIVPMEGMTWADGMGIIVLEGLVILVLVLTGFRTAVFRAVPAGLKTAISVGIGMFIALIGLVNAGIVTTPSMFGYQPGNQPGTPLQLGTSGSFTSWPMLVFILGLIAIVVLTARKVKGAMLYSIIGASVLAVIVEATMKLGSKNQGTGAGDNPPGWNLNAPSLPEKFSDFFTVPDFSLIGHFSLFGAFGKIGVVAVVLLVFSLLLADFFDTMGTMVAVGAEADLLDEEGNPPNTTQILVIDSLGAVAGGVGSVSSNTAFIESASGVGEGARTGLASIVTGVAFLLATFLSPLVSMVPYEAATPALVFVGFLMMTQVTGIKWSDFEIALPAFLTIAIMPFTFSITDGIGFGFLFWVAIKLAKGKIKEIHPLMWVVSLMFLVYFGLGPIKDALL